MTDLLSTIRAEIGARMRELAPLIAEYERLSSAADALAVEKQQGRAVSSSPAARKRAAPSAATRKAPGEPAARKPARRPRKSARRVRERSAPDPSGQAVLAALEHGSHTVAELVVVTALPAPDIRDSLRDLRRRNAIVKTARDGRSAYALPATTPAA